jgi:hypothetical protein
MGTVLRADDYEGPVVTFVETLLPPGIDGVRAREIEYVTAVETASDLPAWVEAARIRDVAILPKLP